MVATVTINPYLTSTGAGSFNIQSDGYIQGQAMDDPSARYRLRMGVLANTETLPMWGGVGISETTKPYTGGQSQGVQGGLITRATTISATGATGALTGFSVFDQDYAMINSPQSPVPLIGSLGQVNFYPLGSLARIAVNCNPLLVNLEGNPISQQVSWDFLNQQLIPFVAAYSADNVTAASYNSGTGLITITLTTGGELAAGDVFTLSGIVSTGAGANLPNGYNGTFVAAAGTTGTTLTYQGVAGGGANTPGTYSSGGKLNAGGGAVPCKVLDVQNGNSMTVVYASATGFATWNRSGTTALIQI